MPAKKNADGEKFPGAKPGPSQARFPRVPRKTFPSKVPKQGSRARFPSKIPKQGSQRFPGRGSQARFPKVPRKRFSKVPKQGSRAWFPPEAPKVPRKRFPSKVRKQGSQDSQRFPKILKILKDSQRFPTSSQEKVSQGPKDSQRFPRTGFQEQVSKQGSPE